MLWWGRLGKVLQLLAACVIVLEILGPERIRLFAGKLRTFEGGDAWMLTTFMIALVIVSVAFGLALPNPEGLLVNFIAILACMFCILLVMMILQVTAYSLLGVMADILDNPALDRIAKTLAFLALILGAHFELLST